METSCSDILIKINNICNLFSPLINKPKFDNEILIIDGVLFDNYNHINLISLYPLFSYFFDKFIIFCNSVIH